MNGCACDGMTIPLRSGFRVGNRYLVIHGTSRFVSYDSRIRRRSAPPNTIRTNSRVNVIIGLPTRAFASMWLFVLQPNLVAKSVGNDWPFANVFPARVGLNLAVSS